MLGQVPDVSPGFGDLIDPLIADAVALFTHHQP
jgi:hypothetical protein